MGVSYQLDSLSEILPGAEVTGVIDSAWYPSELTDLDEEPAFDYPAMHTFWNSQVDATCGIDNPDEPWLCLPLPDSSEYLDTPVFISVDQSDEYLLDQLGLGQNPQTPEEILFVDTIRNSLQDSLAGLDGVFSPNQNLHTLLASEKFTSITILDQNYAQTLGNWYFSRPGNTKVIEE